MNELVKKLIPVLCIGLLLIAIDCIVSSAGTNLLFKDKSGDVMILRPDEGKPAGHIYLKAHIKNGKEEYEKKYDISVDAYSASGSDSEEREEDKPAEPAEELAAYELRSAVSGINDDISVRKVFLPSSLSSGEKITWSTEKKTNTIPLLILVMLACLLIYKRSTNPIKQLLKARNASITRQLPEFVNKLVLLLNAGLVLSAAFDRTVEESLNSRSSEDDYFYSKLREISKNMKEMNSPLNTEFRTFAKESGHSGLMRISNILSDNINKGVELTEKLQSESEVLWINRKRDSEERGRISETKLTLPLVLFLLVLIVITVSPALLEL